MRALLTHLPRYVQHLQRHPHSLLARLLGTRDPGTQDSGARGRGEDREREGEGARVWDGSRIRGGRDLSPSRVEGTGREAGPAGGSVQ